MDRVSSEFYKNVLLLTKFVPPHDDFKKHFKEGIFDKPNTVGFIHVTYYLLNVHYKDKLKVQWPVICKQTENKFRNDARECLLAIANENPDVNFPPIFASHLLLAKGTKFLLIMWKFSLVVLRAYLKNKYQCAFTTSPKSGPCSDLTREFLTKVTEENNVVVSTIRQDRENIEQQAKCFLEKKSEKQNALKAEILNTRNLLKQVINDAPVNAAAKKTLSDVQVNEIINMWTDCINQTCKSLEIDVESLTEEYKFLKSVENIVSVIKGDLPILNARNLDPINIDPLYQLVPPDMQVLPSSLYNEKSLNLMNLFTIFIILLRKLQTSRGKNQVEKLSVCQVQLEASKQDLKTAVIQFQDLLEEINSSNSCDVKKTDEFDEIQKIISNVPEFDKVLFTSSPSIHINSAEGGSNFNSSYLQLTPVQGAHSELFSRHLFTNENLPSAKKPLHVQRINFDDPSNFESSRFNPNTTIDKQSLFTSRSRLKNGDKYSRIFSTRSTKPDNKANKSIMSMMLPLMNKHHNISLINSCNSSQDISQNSLLMDPNSNSTIESSKDGAQEKENQTRQKRRSISDLVERYKKILQERERDSQ